MRRRSWLAALIVSVCALSACTNTESATNLHSSGPPPIDQVRLDELFQLAGGTSLASRRVFAFGTFPGATPEEEHAVTTATPVPTLGPMRIILGKLLLGNYLQ